jgi:ribosomal protein S18 acetylase RimI-like enzyme
MKIAPESKLHPKISIEKINILKGTDLTDLCDATESTLSDDSLSFNIGLSRIDSHVRDRLESYWKGTLLVPQRALIIGRLDGVIAASIQLIKPDSHHQSVNFAGSVDNHFVAPWARGYGLAKELLKFIEMEAVNSGLSVLKLSVRANLKTAINLYESSGYKRWGTLEKYEKIDSKYLAGHFYCKDI